MKRLSGSALQFALLTAVMVALLLSAFLLLTHTRKIFSIQSDQFVDVVQGTTEFLAATDTLNARTGDSIRIERNGIMHTMRIGYWGGFSFAQVTSTTNKKTFSRNALLGSLINDRPSLYLSNNEQPLVLAGNTRISGLSYIPKYGVKPGSIGGSYFNGTTLIDGVVKESSAALPRLDTRFLKYMERIQNFSEGTIIPYTSEDHTRSFSSETLELKNDAAIVLTDKYFGNIIIRSKTELIVSAEANLDQVILVAPKIRIQSGFEGSLHAIASEEIEAEKNVQLDYPSSLILKTKSMMNSDTEFAITIDQNSSVYGSIVWLGNGTFQQPKATVHLAENALLYGELYNQGYTSLRGKVTGSVLTNFFLTDEFGTKYINHLYNTSISTEELSETYAGLPFEGRSIKLAKWLY